MTLNNYQHNVLYGKLDNVDLNTVQLEEMLKAKVNTPAAPVGPKS